MTPLDDVKLGNAGAETYWLASLEPVPAPEGCSGADWFVYRIADGVNGITGYRCGTRAGVRADVETIVAGLNDRRSRIKPSSRAQRRAASQIRLGGSQ